MEKNKEVEYKIMLDEETFHHIIDAYDECHTYEQTNYYFTSHALEEKRYALRVRSKDGHYEMTLKIPDGFAKIEHNENITEKDLEAFKNGSMPDNGIKKALVDHGIDPSLITYSGSLKTIRHDIALHYGVLSLDENFYNGHHDFEFEFEVNNEEEGKKQFEELCETFHLSYSHNCNSKLKRFLDTLI
jgi:uncharacterized protein YjbK